MLDQTLRPLIDPTLEKISRSLLHSGLTANMMTAAGMGVAVLAMIAVALGFYFIAFLLVLANRLCDGLDGPMARLSGAGASDWGGFLDIVADYFFYGGIVFAFILSNPDFAGPAAFLLFTYILTGVSFLAFATMAAKRNLETKSQGQKSFYYLSGLCEGSETIIATCLMCLFPKFFPAIAILFGVMCFLSFIGRVLSARAMLKG